MERKKIQDLLNWKDSKNRKPLILDGARQVGKTWLLRHFGEQHFSSMVYVNFYGNTVAKDIFELDLDPERIVNALEAYSETKIVPNETLIVFDEIQECPKALASLKNFYESAPHYCVACAGSLLGLSLHEGDSYPVGKVTSMKLYPLCFSEFIRAVGKEKLADALDNNDMATLAPFHNLLIDLLKTYLVTGGMPEVVNNYLKEGNILQTRMVQQQIINDYIRDFSKHAPSSVVPKIWEIFNIIPTELAKENKKFLFSMLKKGARASEYEDALLWLEDAGVATRVHRVETIKMPLSSYEEKDAFKLYLVDVGLLGAMANLDPKTVLEENSLFVEFKGAIAEQFAFQEMIASDKILHYYRKDKPSREVDFLLDLGTEILPIEVKSGGNTSSASLAAYIESVKPRRAIVLSKNAYSPRNDGVVDIIPLYLAKEAESVNPS